MTIVVYKSVTGNTKRYAEMISQSLSVPMIELKETRKKQLRQYDTIIYGGPVHAGFFRGIKKAKRLAKHKKLIAFACGSDVGRKHIVDDLKRRCVKPGDHYSFYYAPGGMRYQDLKGFFKFMVKTIYKSTKKKVDKTEEDLLLIESIENPKDYVDIKHVEKLIEEAKAI